MSPRTPMKSLPGLHPHSSFLPFPSPANQDAIFVVYSYPRIVLCHDVVSCHTKLWEQRALILIQGLLQNMRVSESLHLSRSGITGDQRPPSYPILTTSQSMPSLTPVPSTAEQAMMVQLRSLSSPRRRASEISPAPFAPGWSCLLANTKRAASFSSSSLSSVASSSAAVCSRSMSVESMTKMTAAVLA